MTEFMEGENYKMADEVAAIAKELVEKHHPHLKHFVIAYVFRAVAPAKHGFAEIGKAKVCSERDQLLHGFTFVITMSHDLWKKFTPKQKRAAVDHELCHCAVDAETGKPYMRYHDIEEFGAIVERHGLWARNLKEFADVVERQLELALKT